MLPLAPQIRAHSLEQWNNLVGAAFAGCVVDAAERRFDGALQACPLGDLKMVHIDAPPSIVRRWVHHGPQRSTGTMLLHLQGAGHSINTQNGHSATLAPGAAALCDPDRAYSVAFPTAYEMFVLQLSCTEIIAGLPEFDPDQVVGRPVDPACAGLLLGFLRTARRQSEWLAGDADWRDCVSQTAKALALRAIGRAHPECRMLPAMELRRAVLDHIRTHLADPALRTSGIAASLSISPRLVQTVFERVSTTATAYILEQRLLLAAERLRQPRGRMSITDLAYTIGFSDSAYFSRCFRARYAVSPRQFRDQS